MLFTNIAKAARDHYRLVITLNALGSGHLKGSEIPSEIRSTKFIIKSRGADRTVEHNLQRGNDSPRAPIAQLPWLALIGYFQMRNRKTRKASFRL